MKFFRRLKWQAGTSPGSVIPTFMMPDKVVSIDLIDYKEDFFEERKNVSIEECLEYRQSDSITWINVTGIHDSKVVQEIGDHYGLHPLVQEDIVHPGQRPKIEDYDDYLFWVLRMLSHDEKLEEEQISLVFGKNFLISFQEREGDVFDAVRERVRKGKGRIRNSGSDYLAYALLDTIVDHYCIVIELLGTRIESIGEKLFAKSRNDYAQDVFQLRMRISSIRRTVWPTRELVTTAQKLESPLIRRKTILFLRDVYDHLMQAADLAETVLDVSSGLLDLHLSNLSNRMNEVMKVLTIMASIFIPLTFIAGIYGMNFQYMPELEWRWGYFVVLSIMLVIFSVMLIYFKRKKWL